MTNSRNTTPPVRTSRLPGPRQTPDRKGSVESVQRALLLIKNLQAGNVLSVKEAAELLDVAPATAHRLLSTLCLEDFAIQGSDRKYRGGVQLSSFRPKRLSFEAFSRFIRPLVSDIRKETGETIHVWSLRGAFVNLLYAERGEMDNSVPHDRLQRVPAYATSSGRSILAELTNHTVESIHSDGLAPWRDVKINSLPALKKRLSVVRREGFETTHEEAIQGTGGFGICVRDPWARPLAAFGLAMPNSRFSRTKMSAYVDLMRQKRDQAEEGLLEWYQNEEESTEAP